MRVLLASALRSLLAVSLIQIVVARSFLNITTPGTSIINGLEADDPSEKDIKCLGPPQGSSAINIDGEEDGMGINIVGWWATNNICVEAFDYRDPTEKLFTWWSRDFNFPKEYIKEVREWDYDLDVGFHTLPEEKNEFFLTVFGTAHGKTWEGDVVVSFNGVSPGILSPPSENLQPFR